MTFASVAEWLMDNIAYVVFFSVLTAVVLDVIIRSRGERDRDAWAAIRTSVVAGFSYAVAKSAVSQLLMFAVALHVHDRYGIFELSATVWWTWIVLFVSRDFVYYWVHRAEHRFAGLWASHMIHHSSREFSFTTAVRMPWMEALYKPVLYLWAPLMGFHPAAAAVYGGLVLMIGQVQHTELWGRMPRMERFFVTPSVHRVHHGSNEQYLDKNYGSMLTIWDHLFGTFEPEVERVRYGLTGDKSVTNVREALVGGYGTLLDDVRAASTMSDRAGVVLARPS
ncbi:MAG: sterol desaturase family protein [Acidimicrobiia bacterium]|nr:sterol desaturase family protein [Acidimicrobiia bacterium]